MYTSLIYLKLQRISHVTLLQYTYICFVHNLRVRTPFALFPMEDYIWRLTHILPLIFSQIAKP